MSCDDDDDEITARGEEPLITMPFWFPFISRKVRGHLHFLLLFFRFVFIVQKNFVEQVSSLDADADGPTTSLSLSRSLLFGAFQVECIE